MFYIHQAVCISPQETFEPANLEALHPVKGNKLNAIEPSYKAIPANLLRRMSKSVRMAVGAILPFITELKFDGVIIGTANAGMEESGKFLDQIVEFDEDTLSPGNFVQSTSNAIAAQISLMMGNTGYNSTHVHKGHSFENAMIDAAMLLREHPEGTYILGGVDEMASNNYILDKQKSWFKEGDSDHEDFYKSGSPGTIPGEGAAMFVVSKQAAGAEAEVKAVEMIYTGDEKELAERIQLFLSQISEQIDLVISGENGNSEFLPYINAIEATIDVTVPFARFKHLSGEYPTASSFALWLATKLVNNSISLPSHTVKKGTINQEDLKNILIYNLHKGVQHSLIWVKRSPDVTITN